MLPKLNHSFASKQSISRYICILILAKVSATLHTVLHCTKELKLNKGIEKPRQTTKRAAAEKSQLSEFADCSLDTFWEKFREDICSNRAVIFHPPLLSIARSQTRINQVELKLQNRL